MDHIGEHFATASVNLDLNLAIRAASASAKKTLNRYYAMTDDADVYRIAMGKT